jgi:PAS domain S-box-containing protein
MPKAQGVGSARRRRTRDRRQLERDAFRLAAIVESSDDAVVSKDLNGVIQTWNKGAERIFGYTAAEAVGSSILIIIPEERHSEETEVLSRIRAGRGSHFETVRRRKDGTLIDISLTTSPIFDATGTVIGASKIARDITEQKRLQRQAEEASRAKDEFLATLSHELRTPLNTVIGYTAMLKERILKPDQYEKALEVISRNASALENLVNDVLDTSRIISGKITLHCQDCDIRQIATEVMDAVRPAVQAKNLTLTSHMSAVPSVHCDPDRLRQILWNLLSNAAKFTPPGGRIMVTVAPSGDFVHLTVADTGIGIPREALALVFHRFWQLDSSQSRAHGGLGLGLALARHFVELHGGQISATSPGVGQGATFEVLLPGKEEG